MGRLKSEPSSRVTIDTGRSFKYLGGANVLMFLINSPTEKSSNDVPFSQYSSLRRASLSNGPSGNRSLKGFGGRGGSIALSFVLITSPLRSFPAVHNFAASIWSRPRSLKIVVEHDLFASFPRLMRF